MSINVTLGGNPISIRRRRMILSDLENIKKSEREHRRRLRSEQVREQSRALSKRILERTRQIEEERLSQLEKDGNTEIKRARDRKLMELHRRYQDIENIGYAHENALKQPDVEEIKKIEEQKNKALAKARGVDAMQQLQESNKIISPRSKQQQRLLTVRNLENERSCMVAQLPKKSSIVKNEDSVGSIKKENFKTASKRRIKSVVSKKSPVKKIKETEVQSSHKKTPRVSVSICNNSTNDISTAMTTCMDKSKADSNKSSNFSKTISDTFKEESKLITYESDDNEPRKIVPITSSLSSKPERVIRYNKENYQNNTSSDLSSTCTTSSSSISDDSSYFSDTAYKTVKTAKKTPLHHTSPITSKIDFYDHRTRQRNSYDRPSGLVERVNLKNQLSAEDLAQKMMQFENKKSEALASQKKGLEQRTQDACLREKIRRDYQALLKNLDLLSKEERKLKANHIADAPNQQEYRPSKSSESHTRRQKKMDRAFQTILRSSKDPINSNSWTERPITLTPRNYIHSETIPSTAWSAPPCIDGKQIEESYSEDDDDFTHKRKISELLLKIEKLKKRLLQEYGADLPDDVFNASVKSLFNYSNPANQQQVNNSVSKPVAPEIQVINMSSCDEVTKPARKIISQNKKIGSIQTSGKSLPKQVAETSVSTRDQQIQVELEPIQTKDEIVTKPIEPVVTIITPKNSDSNSSMCSNSSVMTDVVVGVNKKEITVLPKSRETGVRISKNTLAVSSVKSKRYSTDKTPVKISFDQKSGSTSFEVAGLLIDANKKKITILPRRRKVVSKNLLSTPAGKSHSLPGSRDSSPAKKGSKSAPTSQQSSPKKSSLGSHRGKEFETNETHFEEQRYKTQYTQVSIDSSTESSQFNYASGNVSTTGASRLFRSFHALTSKHTISKLQDSSDASTTYASPPAAIAGSMINTISRSTPILELLNSSMSEILNRQQVSPVSSPETPSPRTMKLPSNVRRSDNVNKSLKFTSLISKHMKTDSSSISKSNRTASKDKSPLRTESSRHTFQSHVCPCKNSTCKLFHDRSEDTQSFDLKNCPEILEKFEDLKNDCTERIASLTNSIQKLRNEQKGFELCVSTSEDSNPVKKIISNGHKLVGSFDTSKLANSIESIHAQLKKKLMESRKIISGKGIKLAKSPLSYNYLEKSPSISIDLSKDTSTCESLEENAGKTNNSAMPSSVASSKPKIVNNERVNIKLDRFRLGQISRNAKKTGGSSCKVTSTMATTEAPTGTASSAPDQNEDMVEMLSKEILEQSKNINKSLTIDSLKDSDDSILKSSQVVLKDNEELGKNAASKSEHNQSINLDTSISDFVPLLADIPKIPRTLTKNPTNGGRNRPPVTLISGPYRTEIASPVHELSTIVEFDTPDTVNKSQVSNRSPSNKCRKKLPIKEATESVRSTLSKTTDNNKLTKCKPSVHVAPLPAYRSPQRFLNSSNRSTSKNTDKSPRKSVDKSLESPKNKKEMKNESKNSNSSDSMHTLPDVHIDQLQQSQDNTDGNNEFRISEISELQSLPDENIDRLLISDLHEESKSQSITTAHKQEQDKDQKSLSDSSSFSRLSRVSEITTTPTSDLNLFKCPSSPEEMELALKKWGLGWAIPTLKKTREASALGSSSSSDVTPVNAAGRLVSPVKKQQDSTGHDLPMISDVSSISIQHANKSTEKSVLVKGRTSTPNRFSNSNSDDTVSTLESFSSDLNIVVQNQSADITIPNISFSNDKLP